MKTVYFLPCACGRRYELDAGQAGTQIQCSCGQTIMVPSVRGLRQLESQTLSEGQPRATWSTARGAIFSLGLLVSVVAICFSAYNGFIFWQTRRLADPAEYERQAAYKEIDAMNPEGTLAKFRQEESMGLGEPYPPFWTHIDKYHADSRTRTILGIVAAGAGLLATAGSMFGRGKSAR